jgi:2-polyprenyl-3-methyl-5-hydroxy-6-metoxy-1,4-benzoquinol methylase
MALQILPPKDSKPSASSNLNQQKKQAEEHFEKMWQNNPEQFNPLRNCMERERIDQTWNLIQEFFPTPPKKTADLGCGYGIFSEKLSQMGSQVDAVDIAPSALKHLEIFHSEKIKPIQGHLPFTSLLDGEYPLVICTEVIAYLPSNHFRILFSELARLNTNEGFAVCSTPVDIYSEDALQRFLGLAETEFKIHKIVYSHHSLYIQLRDFFEIPSHFVRASQDPIYKKKYLEKTNGIKKKWMEWNSNRFFGNLWKIPKLIFAPVFNWLSQNRTSLLLCEKACRFIWGDNGISHVVFIGSRRPIIEKTPINEQPILPKQKRSVWE